MGLAEVAEHLGVSKGRVGALCQGHKSFPQAVAHIKAGPIWVAAGIERFARSWARQPGRPAASKVATADPAEC